MAICTDPVNACGERIPHEGCFIDSYENGLGPGVQHIIQMDWITPPSEGSSVPEVWVFVQGYKPLRLGTFADGQYFSVSWDLRKSLQNNLVRIGLIFPPTEDEKIQGKQGAVVFSKTTDYFDNRIELTFAYNLSGSASETFDEVQALPGAQEVCGTDVSYGVCIYDCCPQNCTKPYDNNVFCWDTHNETAFALQDSLDPGLAKQTFIATESGVQPIRGVALTRSGDAFDQDTKLLYGSQQWVMVWDFEMGRLVDFFPKQWLRYGAAFYYQNQTLRKEIKAGFSNRKPYYIEIVDLGLVNNPQGAYNLDLDTNGQRSQNWDVPSRILAVHREGQQRAPQGWGMPKPPGAEALYTEFNHLSVDAFQQVCDGAAPALRQKFFEDRSLFLNNVTKQKHHDQIMFLTKEVAERTLRAMNDMIENGRHLVDSLNPESQSGFGYYIIAILNVISQKMLRAKADSKMPNFGDFNLESSEETQADWMRYVYGELRRLVEIAKIDKKDFQTTMLEALKAADPSDPTSLLKNIQSKLQPEVLKQQYDIAANGRVAPGGGVTDPDTSTENQIRGISTVKAAK